MERILIFSGTTEGRRLADWLSRNGLDVTIRVSTEYGASMDVGDADVCTGSCGGAEGIARYIEEEHFTLVIDATHPFATKITSHIREACQKSGTELIRVIRSVSSLDNVKVFESINDVVDYLNGTEGNILVTTGSKDAEEYTHIRDFRERVILRVLSTFDSIGHCTKLGFEGKNLICAQGPFSEEMNCAMIEQYGVKYLVTKDSGQAGGFQEKLSAAEKSGAELIVLSRPDDSGVLMYEAEMMLADRFKIKCEDIVRKVSLIGIGMGGKTVTLEALGRIQSCDLIIGADRMVDTTYTAGKTVVREYRSDRIAEYLHENRRFVNIAVLLSGDIGFYSGARKIIETLDSEQFDIECICGLSTPAYLCSKIGIPWQDVKLISAHGKEANIITNVDRNGATFVLLSGNASAEKMIDSMVTYGMDVTVHMGCDLGSKKERIISGSPRELIDMDFGRLCSALIINEHPNTGSIAGIPDDLFIRGDAPMTKSNIRCLSVSKMSLNRDSIVYDIGAGTGSVSIEAALAAIDGHVYSIEKDDAASDLIEKNKLRFRTDNITVVRGQAPDAMVDLPAPTHAFIGGSSGNLKSIMSLLLEKNKNIRIVANCITLETVSEFISSARELGLSEEEMICVSVSRSKAVGRYHLMEAQNPIYIAVVKG